MKNEIRLVYSQFDDGWIEINGEGRRESEIKRQSSIRYGISLSV